MLNIKVDTYNDSRASFLGNFSAIPTICHVKPESRAVVLRICRNRPGPNIEESNIYRNPNADPIYFPPSASWRNGTLEQCLFQDEIPSSYRNDGVMSTVQHIAVPLNTCPAQALYLGPYHPAGYRIAFTNLLPSNLSVSSSNHTTDQ
ncbi:hypothetical protein EYC80_000966 [Monilinia laxa]|uniref:Uncharacterized protein n=1 Tax=Monilinia laxa TaxID=61186 RepID=A0A5N6K7L0_MONLA|nr:hypothetical protein EYC80_000966 [Monilinia laxa]